ncbi:MULTISPECIES: phosphate signaling complex protein PhoU [Thermosipho]|uniref:Phosphate-specific transport system accessory protein PhoU n=1 Tax=Thermosipho affectus TaxID=660294 RepID=A0ABX3IKS2_9BACT|nr:MULTISPECIES: phosphate signaling complex protein PhoU [Thermosipho]ANQ53054.1 PhoU family transcriptional regulator [Thermosipho sp. 1070]APT71503.1 PhoU family transcriptional regulator [Thermosipho sp. 1063]MBT1248383.1 PhoU family transcriptional regulator [Thermosipho sp. 1244]ONN27923.1 PhoU family transcriptional regulator [Thermosipho affectus]OOC45580.1 PhoU family transcriptional regulator [Thermosipho sp. 1074]
METLHFEREYALLKADISKMLSFVSKSFESSIDSLEFLDVNLANKVIEDDDAIDLLNREIEEKIYEIIARYNPKAKDLRYVITMIKFSNNLERIADLSCNIAEKVLDVTKKGIKYRIIKEIKEMFGVALKMLHDTFLAFSTKDVKLLKKIWERDKELDRIEIEIREKSKLEEKDIMITNILIARDLERIGDHLNNLCEEIVYIETGKELKELDI